MYQHTTHDIMVYVHEECYTMQQRPSMWEHQCQLGNKGLYIGTELIFLIFLWTIDRHSL